MKKTRLGISVGMLGAAIYFMSYYSNYFVIALLVGYVLLFETNEWLKKSAIKAAVLAIMFSIASSFVYLLPEIIDVLNEIVGIFGINLYSNLIFKLAAAIAGTLDIVQLFLFIVLGFKALTQGNVSISIVDKFINKYVE